MISQAFRNSLFTLNRCQFIIKFINYAIGGLYENSYETGKLFI